MSVLLFPLNKTHQSLVQTISQKANRGHSHNMHRVSQNYLRSTSHNYKHSHKVRTCTTKIVFFQFKVSFRFTVYSLNLSLHKIWLSFEMQFIIEIPPFILWYIFNLKSTTAVAMYLQLEITLHCIKKLSMAYTFSLMLCHINKDCKSFPTKAKPNKFLRKHPCLNVNK